MIMPMMGNMKKKADLSALNHLPHQSTHYEIRRQEATGLIQLSGAKAMPRSAKPTFLQRILGKKVS